MCPVVRFYRLGFPHVGGFSGLGVEVFGCGVILQVKIFRLGDFNGICGVILQVGFPHVEKTSGWILHCSLFGEKYVK